MAIYHCSIKIGSRSGGRSAVSAAAYRAGEKMQDHETGLTHDYSKKSGVIHSEIMLPDHAPQRYEDRETLWNAVQEVEKQSNAQLFREIEVALPKEMSAAEQLEAVRSYVKDQFVNEGMCADFAIHDKGDGNPHAHIMLTTRPIKDNGEWGAKEKKAYKLDENGEKIPVIDPATGEQKVRIRKGKGEEKLWERETVQANDWNDKGKAEVWRAAWAAECNKYLDREHYIDHRSYARQGIELEPTHHVGVVQQAMKEKGKPLEFDKTEINAEIKERNSFMQQVRDAMKRLYEKIREKARSLYERIAAASRDHGYVGTTGELAYDTGTTAVRDRAAYERVRGLESLVRETEGRYQYASKTDREIEGISQAIKEKASDRDERIEKLFARRSAATSGRSADGKRGSSASEYRERADAAISNRADRDAERERQAAAERKAALEAIRAELSRRESRSRKYEGPSL